MTARTVFLLLAALLVAACSIPSETVRAVAYSEIAGARIAGGDPAGARDAARLANEAAETAGKGEARIFAELAAAVAQVRAGNPADARRRADALPDEADRVFVLTGLTMALANAGFPGEAGMAAAEATDLAVGLEPDGADQYGAMAILARSSTGDLAGLQAQAMGIGDDDIRNGLLVLIVEVQAAAGDFTGALATAALVDGGPETAENDMYLIGRLLQALSGDSLAVARDLLFDGRVPARIAALNRIAVLQAQQGDLPGAGQVFNLALEQAEESESNDVRADILTAIASNQAVAGDVAGALETLRRAEAVLDGQTGEGQEEAGSAVTLTLAMRDALEGGKVAEIMTGQPNFTGDPNQLLVMKALALVRLGRTGAARETLDFTTRNALPDVEKPITAAAYAILAAKQAELGHIAGARASAKHALSIAEGLPATSEDWRIAMFFAAVALARAGELDLAEETAARIEVKWPEPVE